MRESVFNIVLIILVAFMLCFPFLSCAPAERNYELTRMTISQPLDHASPDGLWTRKAKGLPPPTGVDWTEVEPNQGHLAIAELQNMGILKFLITQNVDNLHLRSGIKPELIAEFHGNITRLRCTSCASQIDSFPDLLNTRCPICEKGKLVSSVVNFGDPIPAGV